MSSFEQDCGYSVSAMEQTSAVLCQAIEIKSVTAMCVLSAMVHGPMSFAVNVKYKNDEKFCSLSLSQNLIQLGAIKTWSDINNNTVTNTKHGADFKLTTDISYLALSGEL